MNRVIKRSGCILLFLTNLRAEKSMGGIRICLTFTEGVKKFSPEKKNQYFWGRNISTSVSPGNRFCNSFPPHLWAENNSAPKFHEGRSIVIS